MAASPPVSEQTSSGGVPTETALIEPDGQVGGARELGFWPHAADGATPARSAGSVLAAAVALVERAGGLGPQVFCPTVAVDPTVAEPIVADERADWAMMPDGIPGATVAPDAI